MRQIDNMTPTELDTLKLKNMLGASAASVKASPFQPLHPSLKKCKCGYIGTKRELYKHFDDTQRTMKAFGEPAREFFAGHGEVPLRPDDPRLNIELCLQQSVDALTDEVGQIPEGHRLDDNNTQTPTK